MEIIWVTEKVVDEREVITHINWTVTAWHGVQRASESGSAALPEPDPALLEIYHAQPTEQQREWGVSWEELPDPPGFQRPEWIERDTLHPWLFSIIDKEAIEAALMAKVSPDAVEEARNANPELFSNTAPADPIDVAREINARLLHKDDDLPPQAPSDWDMDGQGVVEAMPAVSNVPPEIAALLDDGETLTRDVRRKLTERLNVELAELKNLRGLAGEDLKREAEIEKLLGLFARLGEI